MSSSIVRTGIKGFFTTNFPSEILIDFTAEFQSINDLISASGATGLPWVGIQFIGNSESPIGLTANNTQGKYLELGSFYLHVVNIASLAVADGIISRAESFRNKFRGQRIGDIMILDMTPVNFEAGAAITFENGLIGGSVLFNYERRFDL